MLLSYLKDILVRNVKLRLLEIHRSVATVMLVEGEQTMLAMSVNMAHEPREPLDNLRISLPLVCHTGRAHIHLEFETMKRMLPRAHLGIDESPGTADTETGDVNMMIDQLGGIYVRKRALDEV